jgi:nucleotide-binding universal stress UspA family protein
MAHGILVALDGSAFAARAVPYAELLAQRCRAELILARAVHLTAHAIPSPTPASETAANRQAFAEAEEYLAGLQRDVEADVSHVAVAAEGGTAARVLLELAREREVSLIVMATHGRSGLSRWVMGSVAEQVLRQTHVPILLLPPKALDAGPPQRLLQRMAVPVDDSEVSRRIFPVAKELARRLRVPITLIRALEPARYVGIGLLDTYDMPVPSDVISAAQTGATATFEEIAAQWRREGIETDFAIEVGMAATVIATTAAGRQAGWIAMASHGRGGLGGLVLGSTALAVLHRSSLPVVLAAMPSLDRYHLGTAENGE